jgi:hypothetical protein
MPAGNNPMKLKLDENGNAVLKDGPNGTKLPVYVHADGKDVDFDAAHAVATIARLNAEAKTNRERAEAAETTVKAFEGITDAEAARKALETVANLDAGKLITAGKAEEIKAAAQQAIKEQLEAAKKTHATELQTRDSEIAKLSSTLNNELIGGNFNRSKFVADKVSIPADLLQSKFGNQFKVEDGKVVATDLQGQKIYSRARPGEVADFDEAIEVIVGQYTHKDHILKGEVKEGGGANNNGGDDKGGKKAAGKLDGTLAERTAAISAKYPNLTS